MSIPKSPSTEEITHVSISERIVQNFFSGIPGGRLEQLANAAPALLEACKFLMAQVEILAARSFSEGIEEWIAKNDAMNCGKRAISLAEKP